MNEILKTDNFALEVIASGSFLDDDPGFKGKNFIVETKTVRLNQVALNEWVFTQELNCRDCYDTEQEWQDYRRKVAERKRIFTMKVAAAAGFEATEEGITVTQAVSEVFTVVYIHEAQVIVKEDK